MLVMSCFNKLLENSIYKKVIRSCLIKQFLILYNSFKYKLLKNIIDLFFA